MQRPRSDRALRRTGASARRRSRPRSRSRRRSRRPWAPPRRAARPARARGRPRASARARRRGRRAPHRQRLGHVRRLEHDLGIRDERRRLGVPRAPEPEHAPAGRRAPRTGTGTARCRSRRRPAAAGRHRAGSRCRAARRPRPPRPARAPRARGYPARSGRSGSRARREERRQRLIGRGSTRSGGWSMKNWPGMPGSRPPRSTGAACTGRRLEAGDAKPFALRHAVPGATMRPRCARSRSRGWPLARPTSVVMQGTRATSAPRGSGSRRCVPRALRSVDDEIAASAADAVDDRRRLALLRHLADPLDREPGGGERRRGAAPWRRAGSRARRARPRPGRRPACRRRARTGTPCPPSAAAFRRHARPSRTL